MCTAFVYKGKNLLFGYNLDVDPAVWNWSLQRRKQYFSVGIRVGSTLYCTHGVNSRGEFGCLPYMNGGGYRKSGRETMRIDLLVNRLLREKITLTEAERLLEEKMPVNAKGADLHALLGGGVRVLLAEPGLGVKVCEGKTTVVTNYPLLSVPEDENPFYGKERLKTAEKMLAEAGDDFSVSDGMSLLRAVRQEGQWGTRLSFVYSAAENRVYYCLNGNFDQVEFWQLEESKA